MKLVHKNEDATASLSFAECMEYAKELEAGDDLPGAVRLYQKCIRLLPGDKRPYNRLMILYRRQKEYQKELAVIEQAIRAFEKLYSSSRKSGGNNKITRLSKALSKTTGLTDSKGKMLFVPQPISGWQKRKALVQKKAGI